MEGGCKQTNMDFESQNPGLLKIKKMCLTTQPYLQLLCSFFFIITYRIRELCADCVIVHNYMIILKILRSVVYDLVCNLKIAAWYQGIIYYACLYFWQLILQLKIETPVIIWFYRVCCLFCVLICILTEFELSIV